MAVVDSRELLEGRSVSGAVRESFRYTRKFLVRTDATNTSMVAIANAPGVSFGDAHPDDANVYALRFQADAMASNPLVYTVSVEYGIPDATETAADPGGSGGGGSSGGGIQPPSFNQLPPDVWSGHTSITSVPTMFMPKTKNGPLWGVRNTAGTPQAGVSKEQGRMNLTLTRCYWDTSFLPLLASYTNKANEGAWGPFPEYTWLCRGARWRRNTQSDGTNSYLYYSVDWELEQNPDGWWFDLANYGYQEYIPGQGMKDILNADGKPVTEPCPLDAAGRAVPNQAPAVTRYYPHGTIDFASAFGGVY